MKSKTFEEITNIMVNKTLKDIFEGNWDKKKKKLRQLLKEYKNRSIL